MPPVFRWLSFVVALGLVLVAVTAFFPTLKPRPAVAWRQRAALAGALGGVWLIVLYTGVMSSVAPATMLSSGVDIVATVVVFAALILVSFFGWRRNGDPAITTGHVACP